MNSVILTNAYRFIGLLLLQVLVIRQIELGSVGGSIIQIYVYPLFILLLPIKVTREVLLLLGFLLGIMVDVFYNSAGLHASATVFLAFVRPFILNVVEPRSGYDSTKGLTPLRIKWNWFLRYAALSVGLHSLWFQLADSFNFALLGVILVKTLLSGIFSLLFIFILVAVFNPVD